MSKGRKSRRESVLTRQKPRNQKSRWRSLKARVIGIALFCGVVAGGAFIYSKNRFQRSNLSVKSARVIDPNSWDLVLKLGEHTSISDQARSDLLNTTRHLLGQGSHEDLEMAAKAIQKLGSYADVRVTKIAPFNVIISLTKREPVFCVESDKLRLVSTLGEIYGQVDQSAGEACPGPVLSGVFEDRLPVELGEDLTVTVDSTTKLLLREAITLLQDARKKDLVLEHLQLQKFRGFVCELAATKTEVALGRAPFVEKLDKLKGILDKLALRQEQAQRIELDYQGKAFVKLKKM
ncbi:MAG: hypothetical protein NTY08_02910 [Proteobacteria bacterium]|nr:hypothetical protein [Pseudomonadota bacterium]